MARFKGYLLKSVTNNVIFPNKFIALESFGSLPNAREEIKAIRDDYSRDLTRVTANGTKSSFTFITTELSLTELEAVLKFFTNAEVDHLQRKIQLEYWNDEDLDYTTGYFYRPNITYTKKEISSNDITYNPIEISLVEY